MRVLSRAPNSTVFPAKFSLFIFYSLNPFPWVRAVAFPLCCERVSRPTSQNQKGVITCCRFVVGEKEKRRSTKKNKTLKINSCCSQSQGEALGSPGGGWRDQAVAGYGVTAGKEGAGSALAFADKGRQPRGFYLADGCSY